MSLEDQPDNGHSPSLLPVRKKAGGPRGIAPGGVPETFNRRVTHHKTRRRKTKRADHPQVIGPRYSNMMTTEDMNTSAIMLSRRERDPLGRKLAEIKRLLDIGYDNLNRMGTPSSENDAMLLGGAQGYIKVALHHVEAIERGQR